MKKVALQGNKLLLFAILISIMTVHFIPSMLKFDYNEEENQTQITNICRISPKTSMIAPRILIDGTDPAHDWDNCPWVNGSGTFENPYLICNLSIDGGGVGSCINITSTSCFFRIENCTFINSGSTITDSGIYISNSTSGFIWNNTCNYNLIGISLISTTNITVDNNTCQGNYYGIFILQSHNVTISRMKIGANSMGISVSWSNLITINRNECLNNNFFGIGIYDSTNIIVNENNCSGSWDGILLRESTFTIISRNNCTWNAHCGFYLILNNYTQMFLNFAKNNYSPFSVEGCTLNDFHHNWFWHVPVALFVINYHFNWIESWVELQDMSTADGPVSYEWNFGDGTENSNLQNPTHSFASPGNFTIVLTIIDFDGEISIYQMEITIPNFWMDRIAIIVIVFLGIEGIVYCKKKIPAIAGKVRYYKAKISNRYKIIKEDIRNKWKSARKRIAEEQARWAALARQRKAEELRREADRIRQRREEEEKLAYQQVELARQRREAEEQAISQIEYIVLELAPLFSKLQVGEIAERLGISDESLIVHVVQQMIARKQINATYFKSTRSVAFQQKAIEKPLPLAIQNQGELHAEVRRQFEYIGGKVRLKVKVTNIGTSGLLRVRCMLNVPDSFRLLRVEPMDYAVEGSTVKLQDLLPKEEKTVAFVLEPMICGKELFNGTVSGVDAMGDPFATHIKSLEVEVRCPLFANPEDANLPLVKNMANELPVKSERVFCLPDTLAPANAFELAKRVISERDVRFVGSVTRDGRKDGDPFDESAWFYGFTKVGKKRYVLSAAVSEKDKIIRLATACDDEAGCTGFLAEAGAGVRRELVWRGAFESEEDVVELVCEKCGATLPRAPTLNNDVRCPYCQWSWRASDFFR